MVRKLVLPVDIGRRVILLVIAFALLPAGIISLILFSRMSAELIEQEIRLLDSRTQLMANDFSEKINTLRQNTLFLAQTPPIQGIIRSTNNNDVDPFDGSTLTLWKDRLTTIFMRMADTHPDYYQLRYITVDGNGMEIVNVTNTLSGPVEVSQNELQSKGSRDYFQEAIQLPRRGIYLSRIELNRENGRVSEPRTPVLRSATPIYDDAGEVFGIIIINLNIGEYFNHLTTLTDTERHTFYMVNRDNEFISHPDPTKTFLFDFDSSYTIKDEFTGLGESLANQDSLNGSFTENGYQQAYSFQRSSFDLSSNIDVGMLLTMDYELITGEVIALRNQSLPGLFILGGVAAILGILVTRPVGSYIKKIQTVLEKTPDAIFLTDAVGQIEFINPQFTAFTGLKEEEVIGKQADMITSNTKASDNITHTINSGEQSHVQFQSLPSNIWLDLSIYPIVNNSNETTNFVGIIHDISDRKAMETAEKEKLIAEEANREKSAFLARMSHELRTPLNAIIGYGEMVMEDLQEEQPEHMALDDLGKIQSSAHHLLSLISDILEYSKLEKGQVLLELSDISVRKVLEKASDNVTLNIMNKGLEFAFDCPEDMGDMHTDPTRLSQVVINLLNNSNKYTEAGLIRLKAERVMIENKPWLQLRITDTGYGIPQDKLNHIFQPFVQLNHHDKQLPEGVGLGLTISKRLINALGGNISVTSEVGKGSEFTVLVPYDLNEIEPVYTA